jgi:hypothetical protein
MIRIVWAISIVLALVGANCADAQGTLQHVRDDVRSSSSSDSSSSSSRDSGNDSLLSSFLGGLFSVEDGSGNSLGGTLIGAAVLAPFYAPITLLNDEYLYRLSFAPHPYANGYRGYQALSPELAEVLYDFDTKDVPRQDWAMRVLVENGNDFNGLNRLGGSIKVENANRWGVISNWNYFRERLPCGCLDETLIGDTNLTFRFAQSETASFYSGLGFRMLTDRKQTDFGFNFAYGGDWFPIRPIVVSGVFDAGSLGSAGVVHARGSIGAILYGCEVFAGYDFLRIGSTNLQGPMVGVRLWF